MRVNILSLAALIAASLSSIVLAVPLKTLPGAKTSGCKTWETAVEGSTCDSMAKAHKLNLSIFLWMNPEIGGIEGCYSKIWVGYDYCVELKKPAAPTSTRAPASLTSAPTSAPPRKSRTPPTSAARTSAAPRPTDARFKAE